jgi:hypothetical protein
MESEKARREERASGPLPRGLQGLLVVFDLRIVSLGEGLEES